MEVNSKQAKRERPMKLISKQEEGTITSKRLFLSNTKAQRSHRYNCQRNLETRLKTKDLVELISKQGKINTLQKSFLNNTTQNYLQGRSKSLT